MYLQCECVQEHGHLPLGLTIPNQGSVHSVSPLWQALKLQKQKPNQPSKTKNTEPKKNKKTQKPKQTKKNQSPQTKPKRELKTF